MGGDAGGDAGSPPAGSPTARRAHLCPLFWERRAGTPQASQAAPGTGSLRLSGWQQPRGCEATRGSSSLLPKAWGWGDQRASPTREGAGLASAPATSPCYVCSALIWVTLMVLLGKKSQSLPAAGQGWRQLHHGGSLQPPCGCSLPAQPASRLAPLIPAHAGHIPVASAEAATRWCVIRPCLRAGGSSDLAPLLLWSCVKRSSLKRGVSKLPGLQGKEHAAIRQSTWQTRPGRSYLPPQSLGLFSSGGRSNLDAQKGGVFS